MDAGKLQSAAIDDHHMSASARQSDGPIPNDPIQVSGRRLTSLGHDGLVVTASDDPGLVGQPRRALAKRSPERFEASDAAKVENTREQLA